MKKLKIYLADLIHNQYAYNYTVPLNIGYLAANLDLHFSNEIEFQLFKFPDQLITSLKNDPPDILALSNYDWNVNLNKTVLEITKELDPNIFTCMGGPNIRNRAEGTKTFLNSYENLDAYVLYEGEGAFVELIKYFLGQSHPPLHLLKSGVTLPQVAYLTQNDQHLIMGGLLPATSSKNIPYPSAWLGGYMDPYLNCSYYPLSPIIETTRGCPYACTYCTAWGSEATGVKTIRQFPLDIVFDELEYVFKKANQEFYLFLGDANIGILDRDLEIVQKVKDLHQRYGKVTSLGIDTSKNSLDRNMEVYKILGDLSIPTFAQQTFNDTTSIHIGRKNVTYERTVALVEDVHKNGTSISTDLLMGLPGESKQDHIESFKKAFDAGFDKFQIADIRLLLGTAMEEEQTRKKYGIVTKVRVIPNAFGVYDGRKVIDYEHCIRKTNTMTEQEFLELRLLNAHIFIALNMEIGRPLLDLAGNHGLHPIQLLADISSSPPKDRFPLLHDYFKEYTEQAGSEWFKDQQTADNHYFEENTFKHLQEKGFPKLNYEYASLLITNQDYYNEFLEWICYNLTKTLPELKSSIVEDIRNFTDKRVCRLPINYDNDSINLSITSVKELSRYLQYSNGENRPNTDTSIQIEFSISNKMLESLQNMMSGIKGARSERHAVQLVLQYHNKGFLRQCQIKKQPVTH